MTRPYALHGLYAITDGRSSGWELVRQVDQALEGGARVIQYRDKSGDTGKRINEAGALTRLCQERQALLIINDDITLAEAVGADGVHLGQDDGTVSAARQILGAGAIIGVSCYNRFELALEAQRQGADYVAFGRFFPSTSKPQAVPADTTLLQRAGDELTIPTVAIGGITPENGGRLILAGADMLAVIHGVFGQPDIRAASARISQLFDID